MDPVGGLVWCRPSLRADRWSGILGSSRYLVPEIKYGIGKRQLYSSRRGWRRERYTTMWKKRYLRGRISTDRTEVYEQVFTSLDQDKIEELLFNWPLMREKER